MNWGNTRIWISVLIVLGTLIRIHPFLYNRALEHDEAFLANNIIQKNFSELTGVLDNAQAAPILFLWFEKLSINLLGTNELALRFFPLLFGICALFLFYLLAKKYLDGPYLVLATGFFVCCSAHIFYSTDVKQYSLDVLVCIVILLLGNKLIRKKIDWTAFVKYGVIGAIAVWFSQPSIFVLAGSFLAIFIFYWSNQQKESIKYLDLAGVLWGASFLIYYFCFLRHSVGIGALQDFHQPYYMPLKFWEFESWKWYLNTYFELFRNPVGILFHYLAGTCFAFALYDGYQKWRSENQAIVAKLLMLILPIIATFGASALQKYSTIPRLMLFVVPMVIILLCHGLKVVGELLSHLSWYPYLKHIGVVFGLLLLLQPVLNVIHQSASPKEVEEIKTPLSFIEQNKIADDKLYVYPFAKSQFDFYKTKYDLSKMEVIMGASPYADWKKDLEKLKGEKRVWVLLSHHKRMEGIDDREVYPTHLNTIGKLIGQKEAYGSIVYLYNLE